MADIRRPRSDISTESGLSHGPISAPDGRNLPGFCILSGQQESDRQDPTSDGRCSENDRRSGTFFNDFLLLSFFVLNFKSDGKAFIH
ncbi:MAG: hypothetical protein IJC16_05480 [Rikenellaceae bacterium]|nr:hypothetical protein [Rikenellaceae bacterium]